MASFGAHNFDDGVVIVATRGMDGNTCRLIDDDHVIIFVDDPDGLAGDGRLVTV